MGTAMIRRFCTLQESPGFELADFTGRATMLKNLNAGKRTSRAVAQAVRFLAVCILALAATGAWCATATIKLTPATVTLPLGQSVDFAAEIDGKATNDVYWRILPAPGVTAGLGALSATGVYRAPGQLPSPTVTHVTIEIASKADPKLTATAVVTLFNAVPVVTYTTPALVPVGISMLYFHGNNFLPEATVLFNGKEIESNFVSPTLIEAVVNVPKVGSYPISVKNVDVGGKTSAAYTLKTLAASAPSYTATVRFLEQCTFGPTPELIAHVQSVGFEGFLAEQYSLRTSYWVHYPADNTKNSYEPEFYTFAVSGQDQFRQRVALALSEIFVTSGNKIDSSAMFEWQNMLLTDALSSYTRILHDVTISPAMGQYLDMVNNAKGDPTQGTSPDENYAREVLQLFSVGLNRLNQDGTPVLDKSGNPTPNYDQDTIEGFASAFTGWTFAPWPGKTAHFWDPEFDYLPMVAIEEYHDTNPKKLLNGTVLPGGQTAEEDLVATLANIAENPNVAPFFSKQLIQHLVTSNPSPAYVARVAAVFTKNSRNLRGDMMSVLEAILLDPEARAGDNAPATANFGHLREPAIFIPATMRAVAGLSLSTYDTLWYEGANMGQDITNSPDVFDYFPIGYEIPSTGQVAPEMGILFSATAIQRADWVADLAFSNDKISGTQYSLDYWTSLGDGGIFMDQLNLFFFHGQMSSGLRAAIQTAMNAYPATETTQRVQQALYVAMTSPEYQVEQ